MTFGLPTVEYRLGLNWALAELARHTDGYRPEGLRVGDGQTFLEWCDMLAEDGMKIDGKPFSLEDRAALRPIYAAIPTTREQANHSMIIIQKATQLGLTVWEVLANIYMAMRWEPANIGMFLPDQPTASFKSEQRFMRIVRSVPQIHKRLTQRVDLDGHVQRIGEGNVLTRVFGESLFMFLWTSGKVTTESRPMDIVSLDEVQEMNLDEIDKVIHRIGDSHIAYAMLLSTANMPDLDINFWYQLGTQEVWHTRCPSCNVLTDLSDPGTVFPKKSIVYNEGKYSTAPMNDYVWCCPSCEGLILDPQLGEYVITNPTANPKMRSFLLPRTISPRITPRLMAEGWGRARTGDQKKAFYNRVLARPYIDADQLPVTMEHCLAAVRDGIAAGVVWKKEAAFTYMGIDQMGSFNAVIIKERLPDGRQAVIHVEAVFNDDPFARCAELMDLYHVQICVVEQLPNVNDARRFMNKFRGRVFLAGYQDYRDDYMQWGDDLTKADRKTNENERTRHTVTMNQYKCMQASLYRIRDRHCLFPDPDALIQDVLEGGVSKRMPILRDWVFLHFTRTAIVVEQKDDERKPRARVLKIGIDPHFSFANMLCDVAWARNYGTSSFILPEGTNVNEVSKAKAAAMGMPGLPVAVVNMIQEIPPGEICGNCTAFKDGQCMERHFGVGAKDAGCQIFVHKNS